MPFTGKLSQTKFVKQLISFAENDTLILDQNSLISIPYPRVNSLKTIPFTAAHTYIAHIWEYPPPLGPTARRLGACEVESAERMEDAWESHCEKPYPLGHTSSRHQHGA